MSEAGLSSGFTFGSVIGATAGYIVRFGELIQGQLRALNINMDLKLVDQAQAIPLLYREGGHGTAGSAPIGVAWGNNIDQVMRQSFLREGFTNPGGVEVPGVRELLDRAAAAPDQAAAGNLYKQVNGIVARGLYACIPVYYDPAICGYRDYIGGVTRGFNDADTSPDLFRGMYISEGKVPTS
jgi:ABC-type transport system substrate-binding protein